MTPTHFIEPLEARIAPAFAPVFELSSLNGTNGFAIHGVAQYEFAAIASDAGDVNSDGFDDVIIGAPTASPNGGSSGASYVVFGKSNGFSAALNLSSLNGSNGFKLSGVAERNYSGRSVSGAGDINGDGFADVIVGAPRSDANGFATGASYVVFGKPEGFQANLNLSSLNGSNGFLISGAVEGEASGGSVSTAGDVNGDGIGDIIIGAPSGGASYVVFGKRNGFPTHLRLSELDGSNGFKLSGADPGDLFGFSVSGAGDVNGDGFADVMIGASRAAPGGNSSGASYVVFGKASGFPANVNVSSLDGSNGFKLSGSGVGAQSGYSVSGAGDVNGDGFDDVIIGAYGAQPSGFQSGAAYVVFGKSNGFQANLDLSALDGRNGFRLPGLAEGDYAGRSVSSAGDVNRDGFDDVIIGAVGADPNGKNGAGASYVVFGSASPFPANFNLSSLNGRNGFKVNGVTLGDYAGTRVSTAGDVNGDGFDDVIIGAQRATYGSSAGASYVVFGRGVQISVADATVEEGDDGTTAMQFTVSLSEAGRVPVQVEFFLKDGTAREGDDFTGPEQLALGFAPGETSKTVVVNVLGDTTYEGDETFSLVLGEAKGGVIRRDTGVGTVRNDDAPPVVSVADASVVEGDATTNSLIFTVSLSAASGLPTTVNIASADGTAVAGSDFTAVAPRTLTFAPGETTKTIGVSVLADTRIEDHETLSVALSEANGATIGAGTAMGTILNDDTALRITGPLDALEGDAGTTPFDFTVTLEKPSALPVTVNYETFVGSATPGSDFTEPPEGAQITFAPGEVTRTITVDVLGDTTIEDDDSFGVLLSGATNALLVQDRVRTVILNDDTAIRIAAPPADLEGDSDVSPFVFTISLEQRSAIPVTVSYTTADGTATAGSDYEAVAPTQLTFAAGETTKTVEVNVFGDAEGEAHETFAVILSGASGAMIAEESATGTILNDDTRVQITNPSVLEGHSGSRPMIFTVTLTEPSALPVRVNFATVNSTATAGTDYTAVNGALEFAPGETTKTIIVEVLGDIVAEGRGEGFTVQLTGAVNATMDNGTGDGTILDDDVTLAGPRKATFRDADEELVTIKVSKGTLKVEDFTLVPAGAGAQLALVDFSGEAEFAGAKLSITAKAPQGVAGDGFAHVGYINATGIDLGKVRVKGGLGQIDAGDGLESKPGLKSLSAQSIGASGLATQLPGGSMQSDIVGALGSLKLKDGMHGATLSVSGDIRTVMITGDVRDSALRSDGEIGAINITGDLAGTVEGIATISARGILAPASASKALAIGSISISGSVERGQLLAGYDRSGGAVNGDAGIGPVFIGGDWSASSLAAGARPGEDGMFGTGDDAPISPSNATVARIASILIKGSATGSAAEGDHFGFVAEEIGFFKAGGVKFALTPGAGNDLAGLLVGGSGDLRVREVA